MPARLISPERKLWPAGQVADFVGHDALQLVGVLGLQDQAGVDPHHAAARRRR